MRIPKSFINPWTREEWTITIRSGLRATDTQIVNDGVSGEEVLGVCDPNTNTIGLNTDYQDRRQKLITLLHEGYHSKPRPENQKHVVHRQLNKVLEDVVDFMLAAGLIRL